MIKNFIIPAIVSAILVLSYRETGLFTSLMLASMVAVLLYQNYISNRMKGAIGFLLVKTKLIDKDGNLIK